MAGGGQTAADLAAERAAGNIAAERAAERAAELEKRVQSAESSARDKEEMASRALEVKECVYCECVKKIEEKKDRKTGR